LPLNTLKFRWLIRAGFVLAIALTLFFGVRTVASLFYWSNPDLVDRQIEGWMPVGYVGRSWDIPRDDMIAITGIETPPWRGLSIEQIAEDRGIPLEVFIAQLLVEIQAYRDAQHD